MDIIASYYTELAFILLVVIVHITRRQDIKRFAEEIKERNDIICRLIDKNTALQDKLNKTED